MVKKRLYQIDLDLDKEETHCMVTCCKEELPLLIKAMKSTLIKLEEKNKKNCNCDSDSSRCNKSLFSKLSEIGKAEFSKLNESELKIALDCKKQLRQFILDCEKNDFKDFTKEGLDKVISTFPILYLNLESTKAEIGILKKLIAVRLAIDNK